MNSHEFERQKPPVEEVNTASEKIKTPRSTYQERGAKTRESVANQKSSPEQSKEALITRIYKKAQEHPGYVAVATGLVVGAAGVAGLVASLPSANLSSAEANTSIVGEQNEQIGIYDGYGEKGMWLSGDKGGKYDFASASEVAEVCDDDECEMVKYTAHNQVESFADYLANLPENLQPEGFKGLTILETEKRLEGLPDAQYEEMEKQFDETIDKAFTREATINGTQNNAYMRLKNPEDSITHDNMEVVACTTNESDLRVMQFYWTDENGNEIGHMNVKMTPVRDTNGYIVGYKGCNQVVSSNPHVYTDMPKVPDSPPWEPGEPEKLKAKDPNNLKRIDKQINQAIEDAVGTEKVSVTPNQGVSNEDLTEKPSSSGSTGAETVQNEGSKDAEPVQNGSNNYSEDRGGANANEYAPVKSNEQAQAEADANETPYDQAPTGGADRADVLSGLGIN